MKTRLLIFILLIFAITGCNPLKRLGANEYLLQGNKIRGIESTALRDEMEPFIRQKPNRKILYVFRFHLTLYNLFNQGKSRKYKEWVKNNIAEPPVILDTTETHKTDRQLQKFLQNKGFLDASVKDSIVYLKGRKLSFLNIVSSPFRAVGHLFVHKKGLADKKDSAAFVSKRKVIVNYLLKPGSRYKIDTVLIHCEDKEIKRRVIEDTSNNFITPGQVYEEQKLQQHRDQITNLLKNEGYYDFQKQYIHYELDTSSIKHTVTVSLFIDRINENSLTEPAEDHKIYQIKDVFINLEKGNGDLRKADTTIYQDYHIIYRGKKPFFKPWALGAAIFIKPHNFYKLSDMEDTYRRLGQLNVFRFTSIKYRPDSLSKNALNAYIEINPMTRQGINFEGEFTHNNGSTGAAGIGDLGIGGNINYSNKNIFRGGEQVEFKIRSRVEAQSSIGKDENNNNKTFFLFNAIEVGPELSLIFPRFLVPFKIPNLSKNSTPYTKLSTSYNYQLNPNYRRKITNVSFSYSWKETPTKQHIITLVEISGVKIDDKEGLDKILQNFNDRFLLLKYISHLTTATRYTFIFNNQRFKPLNTLFFTGNLEFAGNTISTFNKIANSITNETGNYEIFGLRYAQYAKTDVDLRFYHKLNSRSTMAFRIATGIGMPYGNSDVLPLEKSFFGGGANGIRAWPFQRLGPGSYTPSIEAGKALDQPGDVKIEGNIEERFDIVKLFQNMQIQGALFIDAGNVWTLKTDPVRPNGVFDKNTFYKQFAVGPGVGVRFNFGFFIIRLDYAFRLVDPALPEGSRASWKNLAFSTSVLNFGIGYPF